MPLDLDNDIKFQEKNWKMERVGWFFMSIFIFTALLGLFGFGPISKKTIGSEEDGIQVEFHSLLRYKKETPLKVMIYPDPADINFNISINKDFLKGMITRNIVPEPRSTIIGKENYIFSFPVTGETGPSTIAFYLKPDKIGNKKLLISQEGGPVQELDIFIYP